MDRKVAANVPEGVPGRDSDPTRRHFMAAVPRIDGVASDADLSDTSEQFAQQASDGEGVTTD